MKNKNTAYETLYSPRFALVSRNETIICFLFINMTPLRSKKAIERDKHNQEKIFIPSNIEIPIMQSENWDGPKLFTLYRLAGGGKTRAESHEGQQILSIAEEMELVSWITQSTVAGCPARYALVVELAKKKSKNNKWSVSTIIVVNRSPILRSMIPGSNV